MSTTTPERQGVLEKSKTPKDYEIKEDIEIPEYLERSGVSATKSQFTSQVTDDNGKSLTQSSGGQTTTITLPATQEQLKQLAKGDPVKAITWLANFWLRMVKKAFHFGYKIMLRQSVFEKEKVDEKSLEQELSRAEEAIESRK